MAESPFADRLRTTFGNAPLTLDGNFAVRSDIATTSNQQQTNDAFSEKWGKYERSHEKGGLYRYQCDWYLKLYGFGSETRLAEFLRSRPVIFDAGCGLGYKAAWLARLAPESLAIGMDYSMAAKQAACQYGDLPNLYFVQGDIAATGFADGAVDYVSCDQVIMHTENPELPFSELARISNHRGGQVACYFYAKKALPRELIDDHFRAKCKQLERSELWALSEQLAELGRRLSELKISFEAPDIPALGIKGGTYDIQRFIYYNFLKCFWNAKLGPETSVVVNFDWYSPSNARRFSEKEVRDLVSANNLIETFFHIEEACYSSRFTHRNGENLPAAGRFSVSYEPG